MSFAFISKNSFVIFSSGGGPHVSTRVPRPVRPGEPDQIPVVGVVIRMLMRQEHVAQRRQRHTGRTSCRATPSPQSMTYADFVADDYLRRPRVRLPRPRPAPVPRRISFVPES